MGVSDPAFRKLRKEIAWLKKWPEFVERPATLTEFLGPDYLNIEGKVRPRLREELEIIMGEDVRGDRMTQFSLAMLTGGIGIGKTTAASIVLPYMVHWVLCLKDPQAYFGLLPGSRIAFMQMSTSESQAREVIFGDIEARIKHSPWFKDHPRDPTFKKQIRFTDNDVWILPGDSAETTFEGYNILGGILDEADSHKVTDKKDYAEEGFNTIHARITSRFGDRGCLIVIGQMKKANGFASRKFREFSERPDAHAVRLSIWESFGRDYYKGPDGKVHTFYYDTIRKQIVPSEIARVAGPIDNIIQIPEVYRRDFENNPEKALKDLAGIPPAVNDPFISLVHKIHGCRDRWIEHHPGLGSPMKADGRLETWFTALEHLKRVGHIDIGYASDGDALGFAMGHVKEVVEIEGEMKPYIVIDLLMRLQAPPGSEIFLGDVRRFIYSLRNDLGFRLVKVTMDGFQSTDTMQQLQRRRIETELVSVDRQKLPYEDLREAIYEDRIEFPPYLVYLKRGDSDKIEIAIKELSELVDAGNKIDHPEGGTKDVADAMAGVTYTLMGDRTYRRKVVHLDAYRGADMPATGTDGGGFRHPAVLGGAGIGAPIPPTDWYPKR